MSRLLLVGAFTLSLAGMGWAQQMGSQGYSDMGQYGQYGEYAPYGEQSSTQSGWQGGWQSTPQYNPYINRQFGTQYPYSGWESGTEYGQPGTFMGTSSQFTGQTEYPGWSWTSQPYGFAGYGNVNNWNPAWQQQGMNPAFSQYGQQNPWMSGQQGMNPAFSQYGQQNPWTYNQPGMTTAPGTYGTVGYGQMPGWYGQQAPMGAMVQGQRLRVVGQIEQHIPVHQFSTSLNPNDVLVNVRTASGHTLLVDLGPTAETANFAPNLGTRAIIAGHIMFLNGQPVLIAHRAHELGSGFFQAGYGERTTRFPQTGLRSSGWQSSQQFSGY